MEVVTIREREEEERFIGYHCTYRYENHVVKLEYDISTDTWKIIPDKYHLEDEKQLNIFIERMNKRSLVKMSYTFDERIQQILKVFDDYFLG